MSRIVAGAAGGRRLATLPGALTRPTADRTREALFSSLEALLGPMRGLRFLDLYAGSGAVGLEALSRGAAHVLLVEADPRAARVVRANVEAVGLPGAQVSQTRVEALAAEPVPGAAFDVAFLDPPYREPVAQVQDVLAGLLRQGWLAARALVVVERSSREDLAPWPEGIAGLRARRYGEAMLWYGRASG